jgi:hypothetical protein
MLLSKYSVILLDKIYCPEEQRERAAKALGLNGGTDYEPRLLAASSMKKKPTIRIKRWSYSGPGIKLKGAPPFRTSYKRKERKQKKL